MNKEFIYPEDIRNAGIKIAYRLYKEDFIPDVLYVLLRGGAYLGNVISEYFKIVLPEGSKEVFYGAVVARSYDNSFTQTKEITVDGWTYPPQSLRKSDKVLLVDDVFDTGRTINHLAEIIVKSGVHIDNCKIAVYDYKLRPETKDLLFKPSFYTNAIEPSSNGKFPWRHYLMHELVGLSSQEYQGHLKKEKDSELQEAMNLFFEKQSYKTK